MTGACIRIAREDKWINVEFEQLTDREMDEFKENHKEDGWKWAIFFAKFIRDNIQEAL
jgi:hypothetical protein